MIALRKLKSDDIDYFLALNNNPDNLYWMESDAIYQRKDVPLILTSKFTDWYKVVDFEMKRATSKSIGLFTTYNIGNKLYMGIIIDGKYRKQGYAGEVFSTYLKVTDEMKIPTYLRCFKANPAIKLYKRLGYKKIGTKISIRGRDFIEMKRTVK